VRVLVKRGETFRRSTFRRSIKVMAEGNFVQPAIPRFDGHYDHWAMLMENFLRFKEYWSLIEIGIPTNTTGAEHTEAQ